MTLVAWLILGVCWSLPAWCFVAKWWRHRRRFAAVDPHGDSSTGTPSTRD